MKSVKGLEPVEDVTEGKAYRFGYYGGASKSHLINRESTDVTYCGRLVWPEPDVLDRSGIEHWLVYPETRKRPSVCGSCKSGEQAWLLRRSLAERRPQEFYEAVLHPDDLPIEARRMTMSARVVVSGSRTITDETYIAACLREAWEVMGPFSVLMHGGAPGVDRIAGAIVGDKVDVEVWKAHWDEEGRAAGILRNARMLDESPDYAIIIWDGKTVGTEHMFDLVKTRQVPFIAFMPAGKSINKTGRNELALQ